MKQSLVMQVLLAFLTLYCSIPVFAQSQNSRKPTLIRDTEIAEGKDNTDAAKPKEPNPLLAEQNINIGNFYFKKKNYIAAIQRYLEAIEYQPDSVKAYEALARAYEKKGEKDNAIETYRKFIEKYPDSPQCSEFRNMIADLEKE